MPRESVHVLYVPFLDEVVMHGIRDEQMRVRRPPERSFESKTHPSIRFSLIPRRKIKAPLGYPYEQVIRTQLEGKDTIAQVMPVDYNFRPT